MRSCFNLCARPRPRRRGERDMYRRIAGKVLVFIPPSATLRSFHEEMVSYESIKTHYKLSDLQLQKECCNGVILALASELTKWRNVLPYLELDKGVMDAIDHECTAEEGKRRELLERWKQSYGYQATYERLINCLLKASRADLVDVVCKELASSADVAAENMTGDPHGVPHDIPSLQRTTTMPRQRVVGEFSSDPTTSTVTPSTEAHKTNWSLYSLASASAGPIRSWVLQQQDDRSQIRNEQEDDLKGKKEKIKELRGRQMEFESLLTKTLEQISCTEEDMSKVQSELETQEENQKESEENLKEKERKIESLQDSVYKKERELKRVKDEKQETSKQLEKELQEAKAQLERERKDKETTKEQLDQVATRIETLQNDKEKANSRVMETRMERDKVRGALVKMKSELDDEKHAVDELNRKLTKQNKCMTVWICIGVFLLAIVAGLILHNIGLLQ